MMIEPCALCGDEDSDMVNCADCGLPVCSDCSAWCHDPDDEDCGDWFCDPCLTKWAIANGDS